MGSSSESRTALGPAVSGFKGRTAKRRDGGEVYHPGQYAAFALDPDGNNVKAVFRGPAKRSAASVKITIGDER
jgi:hypothetical protein